MIDEKLNTEEDFSKFLEKSMHTPFKINGFQYRVFIGENEREQTYLILQSDHSLGDGMGYHCLMSKMTDGFDINKFPKTTGKSFLTKIKDNILAWFFIPFALYFLYAKQSGKTPFKIYKNFSMNKTGYISQKFEFKELYKINKKLKVTFNDLMLALISSASKKYCTDNGYKGLKNLNVICPVNMRSPPQVEEDLKLTNESSCSSIPLELIDDVTKDAKKINKDTEFLLRNHLYPRTINLLNVLSNTYLPFALSRETIKRSTKKL